MQATELFQTLFDQMAEPRIVVVPNAPDFTVVTTNKAYKAATDQGTDTLDGQSLWALFKADTASANVRPIFEAGLNDALRHRTEIKLPIFRFDIAATDGLRSKPRWWQVDINPVLDSTGQVAYLVCTTRNVTLHIEDQVVIRKSEQENAALLVRQQEQTEDAARSEQRNLALSESEYRLNRIIESTPVGLSIIKGRNLVVETMNAPLLKLWGRSKEAVLGQELLTVFPELAGQPFFNLLMDVFNNGVAVRLNRQEAVVVLPDEELKNVYVDFSIDPLFDPEYRVEAVLVTVNDVTEIVMAQHLLQDREEELEVMNEELRATNEELNAINNELRQLKQQ